MQDINYLRPDSIDELKKYLSKSSGCILAGGTDILPRMHRGFRVPETFFDISNLKELRFINADNGKISIGALTTYDDLINSELIKSEAPILCTAAASVGAFQTRQRGTIGGSIGNASPAGDILIALLVLDAEVLLVSEEGSREVPFKHIFEGPGKTSINPNEFIHSIRFSKASERRKYYFHKIGKREAMACSVAGIAITVVTDEDQRILDAKIALGSVAPTPIRSEHAEAFLKDKDISNQLATEASELAAKECEPIDDVRGSAEYRRLMIGKLVEEGLKNVFFEDDLEVVKK